MEAKKVKKDLLYHMEKVVEELKDSQLSKEFFKKAAPHIRYTRVRDKKRLLKVGNLVKNSYLYR